MEKLGDFDKIRRALFESVRRELPKPTKRYPNSSTRHFDPHTASHYLVPVMSLRMLSIPFAAKWHDLVELYGRDND